MDVVKLLQSKNRCLERFLKISIEFLDRAEQGDLSDLQTLQDARDIHLKAIELCDRKISEIVSRMPANEKTPAIKNAVEQALLRKDQLVHQILSVDLKIIEHIERTKSNLLKEMNQNRKSQEMLSKFKSGPRPSGEELDQQL